MEHMEEQIGSILGNPQLMQQIMSMAQNLGQQSPPQPAQAAPEPDTAMIGQMMNLAGKTGPDRNQQALLKALGPYLTAQRISKLEKAMRAARLANLASSFLGSTSPAGR